MLLGYIVFFDLLCDMVVFVIVVLKVCGVVVKILMGDNVIVVCKICCEVGIVVELVVFGIELVVMLFE